MSITQTKSFEVATFRVGELARTLQDLLTKYCMPAGTGDISLGKRHPDRTHSSGYVSIPDLMDVCTFESHDLSINVRDKSGKPVRVSIYGGVDDFTILLGAEDPKTLRLFWDHLTNGLSLVEKPTTSVEDLIKQIKRRQSAESDRLRCFLSYVLRQKSKYWLSLYSDFYPYWMLT